MKKLLILLLGLVFSVTLTEAQNINTDTIKASESYLKGTTYKFDMQYDSAAIFFLNASEIYKKYKLWHKYLYSEGERANSKNLNYDFETAFEIIDLALKEVNGIIKKNSSSYAFILFHKAKIFHNQNLTDSALIYYHQVLEIREKILNDDIELADSYYFLNKVYFSLYDFEKAMDYNSKALKIYNKFFKEDDFYPVSTWNDRGLIEFYQMNHRKAEEIFEYTRNLTKKKYGHDHFENIYSVSYLGILYNDLGDYDKAIECQNEVLRLSIMNLGEDHYYCGAAYQSLADSYTHKLHYDIALEYSVKALSVFTKVFGENSKDAAGAIGNLAITYTYLNDFDNAEKYYNKALEIYKEFDGEESYNVSRIYQSLGAMFQEAGDYDKAKEYSLAAIDIKKRMLEKRHYSVALIYNNLGVIEYNLGNFEKSLDYFIEAEPLIIENYGYESMQLAVHYNTIAESYFSNRNFNKALNCIQKAASINLNTVVDTINIFSVPAVNTYLSWHDLLSSFQLKAEMFSAFPEKFDPVPVKKCLISSLEHYKACDSLFSKVKLSAPSKKDKLLITTKSINIYKGIVETCIKLSELSDSEQEKRNYEEQAFLYSEKNKASILFEALAGTEAQKFAGIPDSLLRIEKNLQIDISYYEKLLAESPDSTQEASYFNKIFKLNREYEKLIADFEKQFPKYHDLKYAGHNVRIEDIQNTLGKKTGMISYFSTDSSLIVYFLTGKKYIYEKWPLNDDFFPQIETFRGNISDAFLLQEAFTNNDDRTVQEYINNAYDLYKLLFPEKVRKLIKGGIFSGIEKLIIIPDGQLSTIPFEALLTENYTEEWTDWNNTDYFSQMPFLLKDLNISYAYSANLFYQTNPKIKDKPEFHDISDWLALAPVFNNDSISGTNLRTRKLIENNAVDQSGNIDTRGWLRDGSYIAPLPGSEEETKSIFKIFEENDRNAVLKTHKYANEEYVKSGVLKDFKFIHIATHGMVNEEKPELSCILLAQDTTSNEDNILFSGEIYNLELNADLTVLSACETGLGKIAVGEGVIGLTRALLYAGSKNIIVSLWQVSDESTNQLMVDFYKNMLAEKPSSVRRTSKRFEGYSNHLQKSKLKLINEGKYAHPFFWSPFVLIGK